MKNYLSFGGGVNSVALHLLLLAQGTEFESVFVHHGTDWPETYDYVAGFQWWLKSRGLRPVTILRPSYEGYDNLYDYSLFRRIAPARWPRWCTSRFKVQPVLTYYQTPCFQMLGIDAGESRRAKLHTDNGVENRFPLIEAGIDRMGCKEIIKANGIPVPPKSGCFICPFQGRGQWQRLRREEPCLFKKAEELETRNNEYRREKGKKPFWISKFEAPLGAIVQENQKTLFKQDEYPPCQCGL